MFSCPGGFDCIGEFLLIIYPVAYIFHFFFFLFQENEKIYLLEQVSESWYRGRTRSGCEGIFPINYVEIKVPLTAKAPTPQPTATALSSNYSSTSTTTTTYDTTYPPTTNSTSDDLKIRCLYNFPAEVEGDLAIKVGPAMFSYKT